MSSVIYGRPPKKPILWLGKFLIELKATTVLCRG
jgi:hypothetical protein